MTAAIPASQIVAVTPSVLSAGGTALELNGLLLTTSLRPPLGTVQSFASQADVAAYFGDSSLEASLATNYFLGFDNSNIKPGKMLFAQYNTASVGAYLRGATLGLTLAQLVALSAGTVIVKIDGVTVTSSSIDLSGAASFSAAAELISVGLDVDGPAGAAFTAANSGTTMTVSAVASGTLAVGQEVKGGTYAAGTLITAQLTGSAGGTGTYTVSISQTVSSGSKTSNTPVCTYDTISGAFLIVSATTGASSTIEFATGTLSTSLKLTSATGAVTSQGAIAQVPSTFMDAITVLTQDWASFTTAFDPDNSGSANKQLFAAWTNSQVARYVYTVWDTDSSPLSSSDATSSLGNILKAANSSGMEVIYAPTALKGAQLACFQMGSTASLDFSETNGRTTMAFRSQAGLTADITNATQADNLIANGYNFYGVYATGNDQFTFFYPGSISGDFAWMDSYVNQIWLNNQFQLALMELLIAVKSIPYNPAGYALIKAVLLDAINQGLNFGAFRAGVTLSNAQAAEVNNAAGLRISDVLTQQGWYLQVLDALPQVRAARGSPPCTFWYMDGGSVQQINLASINVQ